MKWLSKAEIYCTEHSTGTKIITRGCLSKFEVLSISLIILFICNNDIWIKIFVVNNAIVWNVWIGNSRRLKNNNRGQIHNIKLLIT